MHIGKVSFGAFKCFLNKPNHTAKELVITLEDEALEINLYKLNKLSVIIFALKNCKMKKTLVFILALDNSGLQYCWKKRALIDHVVYLETSKPKISMLPIRSELVYVLQVLEANITKLPPLVSLRFAYD